MASIRIPQNPGIAGLDELTANEELFIQQLASLGDPGADRILFWDDSAGSIQYLTAGSGLLISGTTLTATGGGGGTGTVDTIVEGTGITVDATDPANPIVSTTITQYTTELAQDAVGAMVDSSIIYTDGTPLLSRAALTGAITASEGSNTTALGSFTKSQLDTAVSDGNVLYVGDITQYTDALARASISLTTTGSSGAATYDSGTGVLNVPEYAGGGGATLSADVAQTAHGLSVGDVIRSTSTDNTYAEAQADSAANAEVVGIVTAVADVNNFTYTYGGIIDTAAAVPAGAAGTVLFLSASSAGTLTATEPSTTGEISKPLAIILENGNVMLWLNFRGMELADGGTTYTDEQAQDAVGGILTDSSEIDFTYSDATPSITAAIIASSIDETKLDASVNASLDLADSAVQNLADLSITSSAAELNILDGATLTVTELNYVDGVTSAIQIQIDGKQPLDADLTTIAGLTATTDSFMQAKGSAWAARTVAQVKTDLGLTGTNSGDQTSIVGISGTKAEFDTAVSDGNIMFDGDSITNATAANWKVFYSDGSGVITELSLGADGTFLKSNGASSAPTFATPAGSGDVSKVGTPVNNQIGIWTGDGTIEGDAALTYDGTSLNLATAKNFQIAGSTVLTDATGTTTLSNIDAIDATTEATIEAAIDTLANLTSIQGRTVTLADAGANAIFGWDDTAGAYENLSQAEARTVLGLGSAAYVATDLADLNEATIESAIDTLANLTSIQGRTVTLADAGANAIFGWDDAASAYENLSQSEVKAIIGTASDTATGVVELATVAETTTGTDATRAVTPDGLSGSIFGQRNVQILVSDPQGSAITTGDGKACFRVPTILNGWNLTSVGMAVSTVSSSGIPTVQLRRSRRASATTRSDADMLSTKLTVDASEFDSVDAAAAAVIDTSNDDVNTGDAIYVDIDVAGTGTKGLMVSMTFTLP